jgi:hypothetical protein
MDGSTKPTFGNAGPINTGEGNASSQCQSDNDCAPQIPTCNLKCRQNSEAPLKGFPEVPLNWLYTHGYHGSKRFTYADALAWAQTTEEAALFVCKHVLGGSDRACGDPSPTGPKMRTAQWFIVIALAIVMDAGLGAAEPGEGQGVLGIKGRNGAADALDGIPEETALTPDDGSAALKLVERALGCGTNSFDGATPVLMADGHTRPISAIRVGDRIVATDPATGTTSPHTVTALHLNQDTDLTNLTVTDSQHHTAVIHTTQHHPFYDDTVHAWLDASQLRPGDKLHPLTGQPVTVTAITNFISSQPMYNLTIETDHTYYVLAATAAVLVHNCGGELDPIAKKIADHANGEALRPNGDGTHFVRGSVRMRSAPTSTVLSMGRRLVSK